MTTSGGGMIVSNHGALIERAKKLATQSRDPAPHYQHSELGFNYRLSNVLAGIGRGQLKSLGSMIERRREIFEFYKGALGGLPGVGVYAGAGGDARQSVADMHDDRLGRLKCRAKPGDRSPRGGEYRSEAPLETPSPPTSLQRRRNLRRLRSRAAVCPGSLPAVRLVDDRRRSAPRSRGGSKRFCR